MKFAIIEDRIGRLEQFVEFDLKNCEDVTIITGLDFDKLINDLELKNIEMLKQFDVIGCHRSALTNEIRDTIKEYCKINKIPLIFFSGGITSSVFKDIDFPFLHINSKDFYSFNLSLFIEYIKTYEEINLLVLQFGKRWKLSLLLNLRNKIAVSQSKFNLKSNHSEIEIDDNEIIKRVRDLQINSLIKSDLINDKTNLFIQDDLKLISPEQINEVKSVINHLINDLA